MGTLFAIDTTNTVVLAIVSALSVPVPAQREGESELWIAELGLVGELWKPADGRGLHFQSRRVGLSRAGRQGARRLARTELEQAFCGDRRNSVRIGCIRQDPSISATIRVDDLLGKHFAILGTTGTGKSCTTALILRAILQKHPAAHMVLLDPHNEYAPAFGEWAEVISQRNMQLPYWLLTFEELVEVLIGDPQERKAEVEILQDLIPMAKARYGAGRGNTREAACGATSADIKYTVDTPVPYRISDLIQTIDDRMGKLENKRDLSPYRNLKTRLETITLDPRYAFMFGSLTVYDSMAQILGRIFRVPVNDKPITILELTGLPTEIINVVVSVLCRMTFDFALWSEGQVPVTLVCEEAHRYVPANANLGFEPCKRAIAKIAKEGRKYGASLCIVTQRPAEIDSDHPVPVQHRVRAAHVERSRPGDRQVGHLRYGLGAARVPDRARPARGHRLRRRRHAARAHQVRRAAEALHAAQLDRPLHREVAEVGGRRRLPRGHRRPLAQCVVDHGRRRRPADDDVRRGHEPARRAPREPATAPRRPSARAREPIAPACAPRRSHAAARQLRRAAHPRPPSDASMIRLAAADRPAACPASGQRTARPTPLTRSCSTGAAAWSGLCLRAAASACLQTLLRRWRARSHGCFLEPPCARC